MSDRLTDLQRQRALIQGQLEWIDQEIARERGTPAPTPNLARAVPRPETNNSPKTETEADAEAIISQFGSDTKNEIQGVKKGCFIAFGIALALLGLVVFGFYLYSRSRH